MQTLQTNIIPIQVLLVEDNPGDALLTQEALEDSEMNIQLSIVSDGEQALDFLFHRPPFEDVPVPDLVLLDINLPRKNGQEVLDIIKQDEKTRFIPVVMLTTSNCAFDIRQAYQKHANCYITKPVDFQGFNIIIRNIEMFWMTVVKLPSKEAI